MTPEQAKDAAIILLREVWIAGHHGAVKAIRDEFGCPEIMKIPSERGHILHYRAMELAEAVGVRQ
jgi:hypothetical protein